MEEHPHLQSEIEVEEPVSVRVNLLDGAPHTSNTATVWTIVRLSSLLRSHLDENHWDVAPIQSVHATRYAKGRNSPLQS